MAGEDAQAARRHRMVVDQLESRGIRDAAVLAAMEDVPRHLFVPVELEHDAYADGAFAIGHGQTISQPYMVALMTELLRLTPASKLLEVGTGSGYQAAVAARIAGEVWSVERVAVLADRAAATLKLVGARNVHVLVGDGSRGLPEQAPFDAVIVTAAAAEVPKALLEQLVDGGRLVVPIGPMGHTQILTVFTRRGDEYSRQEDVACRFVPLIEWPEDDPEERGERPGAAGGARDAAAGEPQDDGRPA
jgi:protein-L-isoaspartate(D-aspartate) O-methyltransferase